MTRFNYKMIIFPYRLSNNMSTTYLDKQTIFAGISLYKETDDENHIETVLRET